jgi:oxygen-independent coproporphyrinogen-3 oxidase
MTESIYIHLPFCKTKCPYCDFASYAENDRSKFKNYLDALLKEIDLSAAKLTCKQKIKTIFFGGGTPSVHSAGEIKMISDKLREYFIFDASAEITLEANPGTVDKNHLQEFKDIGINRISVGVQSFDEGLLSKLGRGHSLNDTYRTLEDIIDLGFQSWNLDLIYGLPKQDLKSWYRSVDTALGFNPPHISMYALSIESSTPYGSMYKDSKHPDLPEEDILVDMYIKAHEKFEAQGILRYEISNWAKPGHEARHNLTYWRAQEYLAFGLGAHGFLNSIRYANTRNLAEYLNGHQYMEQKFINEDEHLEEEIMLKLRLREGLLLDAKISRRIDADKLEKFKKAKLIKQCDNNISLTTEGILLSNKVIGELLSGRI